MRILRRTDVADLIDMQRAMTITREALRQQADGKVTTRAPAHVFVPNGALRVVSGALIESGRMGLRANGAEGLGGKDGGMLLFDAASGDLLCVMAYPFSTLRTGAVFGVATDLLSDRNARELAMIGSGRNVLSLLQAACQVRPIDRIRIYSRRAENRDSLARRARQHLDIAVESADSVEAATANADIIYVSTPSMLPALSSEHVAKGTFVAGMGSPCELDESVYVAADRVFVTAREHEENYLDVWRTFELLNDVAVVHTLLELDRSGKLSWQSVGELCDVVAGRAPQAKTGETIVFRESQGGYGDIALGSWAYDAACAQGLGMECELF